MTAAINLDQTIIYDLETLPNCWTMSVAGMFDDFEQTWQISEFHDDRESLFQWLAYWHAMQTPMVGFNNVSFDYTVLHEFWLNPQITYWELYDVAQATIQDRTQFSTIWPKDRFAPQIDVFKVHHFDNRAKSTSLKALQVSMRSDTVLEMPLPWDQPISREDVDRVLIPYNRHDVRQTKRFAHFSLDAIKFRVGLMDTLQGDVLNFSDTKIGAKILETRLGDELCYTRENGYRQPRQTFRREIKIADIIFPYVQFQHPEFRRVLDWMRAQTLTADDWTDTDEGGVGIIRAKGVFTGVHATINGFDFWFGTGGIHGSISAQRFVADSNYVIRDIDVASLYPSIAIVNRLYPAHLGERFVDEYARLPVERKEWQAKKGKKCVEANSMKLASNGTYGNSNNPYSVFYDPQFTMSITINGQLLLCMLAEWLLTVPTLQMIQINTDGITYRVHPDLVPYCKRVEKNWQDYTKLVLEDASYSRMWIRDVNNYIAESAPGKLKMKGAYWYPINFPDDISESQPPAWHKDFSAVVSTKAAVAHMTTGANIADFIYGHRDPFEFMCRAKVDRSSRLMIGDRETQRITRYFVSTNGGDMKKISPPPKGFKVGDFKRKQKISDEEFYSVLQTLPPDTHDPRIHTKNKGRHTIRESSIEAGFKVTDCNVATDFDFQNVNYEWYIEQAKRLVIP